MLGKDFEREVELDHSTESRLELNGVVVVETNGTAAIESGGSLVGTERCWPASGQISPLQNYFLI